MKKNLTLVRTALIAITVSSLQQKIFKSKSYHL